MTRNEGRSRSRGLLFCLLASLWVLGCAASPATVPTPAMGENHSVEGLVSFYGRGFEGAAVEAYRLESFAGGEPRPEAETLSVKSGRFAMDLPPGNYFLVARAGEKFAYFGRNPVKTGANTRGISLPLVEAGKVEKTSAAEGEEKISGRVHFGGEPVEGVRVTAHLRAEGGFRGQPYAASAPTGADGVYELLLEPGSYFITAKSRANGQEIGPLVSGDRFGILPQMPLRLTKATVVKADISLVELPAPEQKSRFTTRWSRIEGVVLGLDGKPVEGFRACLYKNPRMLGEPEYISAPTGTDGRFSLSTSEEGRFYLGAREKLGGPPQSGERVGFADEAPEGFLLAPGAMIENVVIRLKVAP